jgi:hypothetical protein
MDDMSPEEAERFYREMEAADDLMWAREVEEARTMSRNMQASEQPYCEVCRCAGGHARLCPNDPFVEGEFDTAPEVVADENPLPPDDDLPF